MLTPSVTWTLLSVKVSGTVTPEVGPAVTEYAAGKIEFQTSVMLEAATAKDLDIAVVLSDYNTRETLAEPERGLMSVI